MAMARPTLKKILLGFISISIVLFIWNEIPRLISGDFDLPFIRTSRDSLLNKSTETLDVRNQYVRTPIDTDINELNQRTVLETAIEKKRDNEVTSTQKHAEKQQLTERMDGRNQHIRTSIDIDISMSDINDLYKRTVLVTAISQNHFNEVKGMIASAQKHMPQNKILVYDLGLQQWTIQKLNKMCNVEVRPFKFNNYPDVVKNIHTYSWKPLIIQETLKEFGAIFYGDSSVRFLRSLLFMYPHLEDFNGFMQHIHSFDPRLKEAQYYMTHPRTFMELKVDRTQYKNDVGFTPWISAGRILYINSSSLHDKIITPMVECALRKSCIAPDGAHRGRRGPQNNDKHSHRFDSSVLSLLVYKNMRGFYNKDHDPTSLHSASVKIGRTAADIYAGHKQIQVEPHCHIRGDGN